MLSAYSRLAAQLYPWRWRFAATTLFVFLALFILIATRSSSLLMVGSTLAGPLISVSWGLLLLCVWFDPTHGKLQTGWVIEHLPSFLRLALQWFFALFLVLWFIFGVIAWPAFAVWNRASV